MRLLFQPVKPAVIAGLMLIFNLLIAYYVISNIKVTDGRFIYPIDDTYIHLTISKNVAGSGHWGVMPDEFNSSSSSPVYTVSLAILIRLFGDSQLLPLYFNIFFGNLLIILVYLYFRNNMLRFIGMFVLLLSPLLLHVQILSGMEHTLHLVLVFATIVAFEKIFTRSREETSSASNFSFLLLTSLLCLTRYESMFFIVGMVLVLLIHTRYRLAMLTLFWGFLPIILFGWYSVSNGGYFFPNSLLLKGNIYLGDDYLLIIQDFLKRLINVPLFLILALIIYKFLSTFGFKLRELPVFIKKNSLLLLVLVTVGQHSLFAKFGWLYRYEAYLYLLICFVIVKENYHFSPAIKRKPLLRKALIAIFVTVILLESVHIMYRYASSHYTVKHAGKNVYDQQIQTSLFLNRYYKGATVIANDIGAITYFVSIQLVDPVGLGSLKVMQLMRASPGKRVPFSEMVKAYPGHSPTIYVIYETWYEQELKEAGLFKAGETQIKENVICGDEKVSFFAETKEEAERLATHLEEFKASIPRDVTVTLQ